VVTARNEEVEGAETREMDNLAPLTSNVASSPRSVPTASAQDISDEAQRVVSPVEGVTFIWSCCLIPRRLFCSVTGSGGSDVHGMNMSRSRDDVRHTTSDRPTHAEAQIRACFLTIVEISVT
jgi:hypothetical protein